ncbi:MULTISPECIES: DUF565 domain-containing protein [Prochlorococcus]|uniref:DUF565 domain-containing protein n=1 Tax=Prochlorococcus TaxID=1218 RepID=UPI000533A340|nr:MULTISPECIES: DUF565 domain-containing protein [Prochlorococcus]KGG12437.1 putative secreted or membrane protein [Prochlorococcus sp. MIT 0601]
MVKHNTNYNELSSGIRSFAFNYFLGPWKIRALSLLSLLIGFYIASSLAPYYLQESGQRIFVVAILVLFIEILIRLKSRFSKSSSIFLISLDNFRIGITYAIVLEAFKLGS